MDIGFAAKPGELALGVLSSALLDGGASSVERNFSAELAAQLAITDELKRLGVVR